MAPRHRPCQTPASHSTPAQKNTASDTHIPNFPSTRQQLLASGKVDTPSATGPLEDKTPMPHVPMSETLATHGATGLLEDKTPMPHVPMSETLATPGATGPLEDKTPMPHVPMSETLATPGATGPLEDKTPMPHVPMSETLATPSATVPLEPRPPTLDAFDNMNLHAHTNSAEDPNVSRKSHVIPDSNLCLPLQCSQEENDSADSWILPLHTVSSDCDRLRTQSPFIPCSFSPMLRRVVSSLSHPGHAGGRHSSDQHQDVPDCKLALTWSPSTPADTGGVHSGSHVEDPPPPSSPSWKLSLLSQNLSLAQKSDGSIGPDHTSKNVLSDVDSQLAVGQQPQISQSNHTPDQNSIPANPLWKFAEKPVVPTSAGVSLSQPSQRQKSTPKSAEKSVCVTALEMNQHFDVVASSEPVTGVKGNGDLLSPRAPTAPPHLSSQQPNLAASLALSRSPGPVHSSAAPPHLSSPQLNSSASHTLPQSPGIVHSSATPEGGKLSRPDTIGGGPHDDVPPAPPVNVLAAPSNPDIDEGLPDSESVERDTAARPTSQSAAAISAPFVQLQNSQAGSSAARVQTYHSLSTNPTKEHSHLSSAANHPTQQSAPNDSSMSEETSDDGEDAYSDVTYNSSTSASTTHNPTGEDSRNSSLHPPVPGMQPRSAPPLTMNQPLTSAVATAGESEMTPFVKTQAVVDQQSNVTGDKQSQNTDQSVQVSMNSREQQLSNQPIQTPPAYHSQPLATHPKPSVTVSSHIPPTVVGLPTSEVPSSVMETSAETCQSAATVVEAADKVDMTASLASSKSIEQMLAVTSGGGTLAASSTLPEVHRQDSGYLGSNQFVSSSLSPRYTGHLEPHDGMPVDGYQRRQDSQGM